MKTRGRPRKHDAMRAVVAVRLPEAVTDWLDLQVETMKIQMPGLVIGRADIIRKTLLQAMQDNTKTAPVPAPLAVIPKPAPIPVTAWLSSSARLEAQDNAEIARAVELGFSKRGEPGKVSLERFEGGWRVLLYNRDKGKRWGWYVFRETE
jgi:hypothetical protein